MPDPARDTTAQTDETIVKSPEKARQGQRIKGMTTVLAISTIVGFIAMIAILVVSMGALSR